MVCIVVLGGWNGYRTGIIRQITRLFGAIIAYFLSYWLRPYVAPVILNLHIFSKQQGIVNVVLGDMSNAIAFGLVFVVTFLLLRYAAGLLDALFSLPGLSFFNRLCGLVAGIVLTIVFLYVLSLIGQYVNQPSLQYQLHHSVLVQWLQVKGVQITH